MLKVKKQWTINRYDLKQFINNLSTLIISQSQDSWDLIQIINYAKIAQLIENQINFEIW